MLPPGSALSVLARTQASSRRGVQGAGLRARTSHGPCRCGFTFAGDRRPGSPYQRIARRWRLNTGEPCRLQGHDTGDLHLPGFASAERWPPSCEAPRHLLNDSGEPVPADGRAAAARSVQGPPPDGAPGRAAGRLPYRSPCVVFRWGSPLVFRFTFGFCVLSEHFQNRFSHCPQIRWLQEENLAIRRRLIIIWTTFWFISKNTKHANKWPMK